MKRITIKQNKIEQQHTTWKDFKTNKNEQKTKEKTAKRNTTMQSKLLHRIKAKPSQGKQTQQQN